MKRIIFDIETAGDDFDALDHVSQDVLTNWIKKTSADEGIYKAALDDLKQGMGFSPLTGHIVAIGALDADEDKGAVYYDPNGTPSEITEEGGIKYVPVTEKEMLIRFWELAERCGEFVGFNSRAFDVPFMAVRSAIHGIRPSKDLMMNRYINSQGFSSKHVDLSDQLSFYGAVQKKGSLHMWCRAFGIKSPKEEGIKGEDVTRFWNEKKCLDIAKYNARDLFSTRELFRKWEEFLR